jgi:hypothetical protein
LNAVRFIAPKAMREPPLASTFPRRQLYKETSQSHGSRTEAIT